MYSDKFRDINRYAGRTAVYRSKPSLPMRWLLDSGELEIKEGIKVLDFGCGKGRDVRTLRDLGVDATGYDLYQTAPLCHEPEHGKYDVVLCTYVLNVTCNDSEMLCIMADAMSCLKTGGVAYFSVRRDLYEDTVAKTTKATQRRVHPDVAMPIVRSIAHKTSKFQTYKAEKNNYVAIDYVRRMAGLRMVLLPVT